MTISTGDRWYKAEVVPSGQQSLGRALCAFWGVGPTAYGTKGNTSHSSGYHRSRNWVLNSPDSSYGSRDYSVTQAADKLGDSDWTCAFDFTPAAWGTPDNRAKMIIITGRVRAAARARDPRLAALREFAGTEDGRTVVTFYCSDGSAKDPFDSSHLDHVHGSIWRGQAAVDLSGVFAIMTGGAKMSEWAANPSPTQPWALTQGNAGYAGQQRDTALAFAWQAANEANAGVKAVGADTANIKSTVAAMTTTLNSVLQLLQSGGGNVDTAAVIARMNALAAEDAARDSALKTELDAALARETQLRLDLAAAFAAAGAAPGPGSE